MGILCLVRLEVCGDLINVCLESVFVHLVIRNPLNVALNLSNLSLRCCFGDSSSTRGNDTDRSNQILVESEEFTVENIPDFPLDPNQETRVFYADYTNEKIQINIIPKLKGHIHILGVVYLIGGLIPSFKSLGKVNSEGVMKAPMLNVTLPMPVLDITFEKFPEFMVSGEVVTSIMRIKNNGNRGLQNLRLKVSHPSFFYAGSKLNQPVYRMFLIF
jgi:hypothetical protein